MTRCYGPSAARFLSLTADNLARARSLASWRHTLEHGWNDVKVESVETQSTDPMHVGDEMGVQVRVRLGKVRPEDIEVQLFHGLVDSLGEIPNPGTIPLSHNGHPEGSSWLFTGKIPFRSSGQHGFAVRVLPRNQDLASPYEPGLVCWG